MVACAMATPLAHQLGLSGVSLNKCGGVNFSSRAPAGGRLALGQVQVVDVEELDDRLPQQMGPPEGHLHAHHLQHHDPADAVLHRTRERAHGHDLSAAAFK